MAKPNRNNNSKHFENNTFRRLERKYNTPGFMVLKEHEPGGFAKDCKSILRDLIFGSIDFVRDGEKFMNLTLRAQLYEHIVSELRHHTILLQALLTSQTMGGNYIMQDGFSETYNRVSKTQSMYSVIFEAWNAYVLSGQYEHLVKINFIIKDKSVVNYL